MDLQWINGTDNVAEMATKTNVNFNTVSNGVSAEISTATTEIETWANGTFETPTGSQTKASLAESNAKTYADTKIATAKTEAITDTQTWVTQTYHDPYIKYVNDSGYKSLGLGVSGSTTQLYLDLVLPFQPTINPTVTLGGTHLAARLVNGGTASYPLISSPTVSVVNGNILTLAFTGTFVANSVYRIFWYTSANINEYLEIDAEI